MTRVEEGRKREKVGEVISEKINGKRTSSRTISVVPGWRTVSVPLQTQKKGTYTVTVRQFVM